MTCHAYRFNVKNPEILSLFRQDPKQNPFNKGKAIYYLKSSHGSKFMNLSDIVNNKMEI